MREAFKKVEALQRPKTQEISLSDVERGIVRATQSLTALAHKDGHLCFELEADATIPSEYILFHNFRATPIPNRRSGKGIQAIPRSLVWMTLNMTNSSGPMATSVAQPVRNHAAQ